MPACCATLSTFAGFKPRTSASHVPAHPFGREASDEPGLRSGAVTGSACGDRHGGRSRTKRHTLTGRGGASIGESLMLCSRSCLSTKKARRIFVIMGLARPATLRPTRKGASLTVIIGCGYHTIELLREHSGFFPGSGFFYSSKRRRANSAAICKRTS